MNYGPLVFLAAFFALASSWLGFVLTPQMQLGQMQETNGVPAGVAYPLGRPGLAREGLEVYRANGCVYCHSQQITQTGTACDVLLTEPGTNRAALLAAMQKLKPGFSEQAALSFLNAGQRTLLKGLTKAEADAAAKSLNAAGAKAQAWVVPVGPDLARGWGRRRSVAQDFLFDYPVQPGSQRVGPDLADVGSRLPDANWHLRHLYEPSLEVRGSTMPAYHFLFEQRRIEQKPSPDALRVSGKSGPRPGYEIVPRPEAIALVSYLLSLRTEQPLFEAPYSVAMAPTPPSGTNTPPESPAAGTNAPATNSLPK